jgi:hypothetical protein
MLCHNPAQAKQANYNLESDPGPNALCIADFAIACSILWPLIVLDTKGMGLVKVFAA